MNGTAALHASLFLSGVKKDDLVLTQALSFVASSNAINYLGAKPIFIDIAKETLSICPKAINEYLHMNAFINKNEQILFNPFLNICERIY